MNTFLGVVVFCIGGQCAFWKSELVNTEAECSAAVVTVIDKMMEEEGVHLVQGVCLPMEIKEAWQKTRG